MKKAAMLLILFVLGAGLKAQSDSCHFTIRGIVLDSLDNSPIEQTNIAVVGNNNLHTISNEQGNFELHNVCPGVIELHISHLNCEHVHLTLLITKDTQLTIFIHHIEKTFSGAKITIKKQDDNLDKVNKSALESNRINGLGDVFKELGGVNLLKTGSSISKPIVNGLHSNRVIIINNGIRQEGQNWGMEHAPESDPFLASDIQLLKGANSLRYGGDGIGGILMVNPPSLFKEKSKRLSGDINLSGFSNGRGGILSGILSYKVSDKFPLYLRMQGTTKRSGNTNAPDYYLYNTGMLENNYSLNLGYSKNKLRTEVFYSDFNSQIGLFTGSQIGNLSDLQIAMSSKRPLSKDEFSYQIDRPYQKVRHQLLKSKSNWYKNALNSFELTLSYQQNHREEYDVLRSSNAHTGPAFDYWISTSMGDFTWNSLDVLGFNIQAGIQGLYQSNAYTGRFFIPGFYQIGLSEYFILEKKHHHNEFEASLRHDQRGFEYYLWNNNNLSIQNNNYNGFSFVLKETINTLRLGKISASISSTWRPPSANELYSNGLHQGIAAIEIGDPNMHQERSYAATIEHLHQYKRLHFEYEFLIKHIQGFINLIPGNEPILTIRGAFPSFYYTQQDALIYGFNYLLKYDINRQFKLKYKGALLNGVNLSKSEYLNQMPPYQMSLSLFYEKGNWTASIGGDYTFKQWRYVQQSDYLPPPDAYILINAEIKNEFKIKQQTFKWAIQVNNLFNQQYRDYLNRFRYYADAQGRNIAVRLNIPITTNLKK
ncbi:MAG: TonB-dependent receptor [Bacteroidia bacterium]|nr:TonB-dependent receptor [Bacteroidia bacterium]